MTEGGACQPTNLFMIIHHCLHIVLFILLLFFLQTKPNQKVATNSQSAGQHTGLSEAQQRKGVGEGMLYVQTDSGVELLSDLFKSQKTRNSHMKPPIHSVDGTFTHPDMYASPIGALQASTANLVRSAVDPRLLRRQSPTNKSPPTKSQTKGTGHKTLVSCVHTYTHTQAVMFTPPRPPKAVFQKLQFQRPDILKSHSMYKT